MGQEQREWELKYLCNEETAINLIKLGKLSLEEIASATGLEIAAVKKFAEMVKEK